MGLSRRKFTREFKLAALERIERGESLAAVARALEVNPNLLQRWRQEFHASPGSAFPGKGRGRAEPDRVAQLERKIGQQTLEIDFLKGCLQRIEQQRQLQAVRLQPHRYDEFPAGYSLAGCAPAEPASASPAVAHSAGNALGSTIKKQRTANHLLTVCLTQGDNLKNGRTNEGISEGVTERWKRID